jgi:hypothetical protein
LLVILVQSRIGGCFRVQHSSTSRACCILYRCTFHHTTKRANCYRVFLTYFPLYGVYTALVHFL